MANKNTLYVVFGVMRPNHSLQLRTNLGFLDSVKTRMNDRGETVLLLPEPVMVIATGTKDELLELSNRLFGTPASLDNSTTHDEHLADRWCYLGDYTYAYRLQ